MQEASYDPKRRRLCPDGACIGLIGADGRCKECGRASSGAVSSLSPVPDEEVITSATSEPADEPDAQNGSVDGSFDPSRRLCDDGSCVGVVVDKVCSVCGRAQE